ncbi:MAG: hypothetical protein H6597_04680 [Flavobacteriales bacterium]|nr:hypothetical protein [Flavobacteriales bacterium]MCB9193809.1 hypothetical protein [Flavobacteriales bacterium]
MAPVGPVLFGERRWFDDGARTTNDRSSAAGKVIDRSGWGYFGPGWS